MTEFSRLPEGSALPAPSVIDAPEPAIATLEQPVAEAPRSRRAVLAGAVAGVAGMVAGRFARPETAAAAAGDPLILGSTTNNSGSNDTQVLANSSVTAFTLYQAGAGTAIVGYVTKTTGNGRGVYGRSDSPNGDGVQARNAGSTTGTGAGLRAFGGNNHGIVATTDISATHAIHATTPGTTGTGIFADATAAASSGSSNYTACGIRGNAHGDGDVAFIFPVPSAGVYGSNDYQGGSGSNAAGVWAEGWDAGGHALRALMWGAGVGITATSLSGNAGVFYGNVVVNGDLSVTGNVSKGGGSFKIDHPLDPANKYLVHSFVESPEMLNVYSGNATTDAKGLATVKLPAWFGATNKDLRYQLTTIGGQAQAWVAAEVKGNAFKIATDKPSTRVSWQVTAVRADAWADAHRIVPEVAKTGAEKGRYLHPELYGKAYEQGVHVDQAKVAVEKHGLKKLQELRARDSVGA